MSEAHRYVVSEVYGVRFVRPAVHFEIIQPAPATLGVRIVTWLSGLWWGFLTAIAPLLPILGAFAGLAFSLWLQSLF